MIGNSVELPRVPKRIVSLVPSQTELLHSLGLEQEVVGITKFCVHPESWFRSKPRVGGTKQLHFDRIEALEPDLIIGNKEENDRAQIEELMQRYPVWMSDVRDLDDALDMIVRIGNLTGKATQAHTINSEIQQAFNNLSVALNRKKAAYLIWREPYMLAGNNTFIDAMMQRCGFENIATGSGRYPEFSLEELQQLKPDLLLLSSEPFPFKEKHVKQFELAFPAAKTILVDGELFSWYGSRLQKAPAYFADLMSKCRL